MYYILYYMDRVVIIQLLILFTSILFTLYTVDYAMYCLLYVFTIYMYCLLCIVF